MNFDGGSSLVIPFYSDEKESAELSEYHRHADCVSNVVNIILFKWNVNPPHPPKPSA
jgi:hypothetical protein